MTNVTRSLSSIAGDIRSYHEHVKAAHGTALEYARKAGEALAEAKEQVKHGEWTLWLERNAPGVSDRTARVYMRIANHWNQIEPKTAESADLSIDQAAKLIAKPKPAEPAARTGHDSGAGPEHEPSAAGAQGASAPAEGSGGMAPEPVAGHDTPDDEPQAPLSSTDAPQQAGEGADPDAVDELAGKAKPKANGAEQVSVKARREAYAGLGKAVRVLQDLGRLPTYRKPLNQIAEEIKPPKAGGGSNGR